MITLASATTTLRVTTSSTSAVDVTANGTLFTATGAFPIDPSAAITTATTTTVVAAPGAAEQKIIKNLTIENKGGAINVVTVERYDGATAYQIVSETLQPGQNLTYTEGAGWVVSGVILPTYPDVQIFNGVGGTWIKPTSFNPKMVMVEVIGAGGGGGAGASLATAVVAKGGGDRKSVV